MVTAASNVVSASGPWGGHESKVSLHKVTTEQRTQVTSAWYYPLARQVALGTRCLYFYMGPAKL